MRVNLRWPSRAEDRFEKWIEQRHQERVLAGETTPRGPCPDEAFLRDLARKSKRIALSDPRVDHAATCPVCMRRLLTMRREHQSRRQKLVFVTTVATCVVIAAVITVARHEMEKRSLAANSAVVAETVNLWDAGAFRGQQPGQLQSVTLPAARVRLTIILPRFSSPGQYVVAVTHGPDGSGLVTEAATLANNRGQQETLSVNLDLRRAHAGQYYLSTTHEQDQASYYYPLQIR
ncbi:hypothetical protein [Acidipila rosea]|uniref:Uncharacterized protein n=1 Tax=Acidipila rosea TaxID=768535 RepID=A0A4R1LBX7_9BACT|nr:hypothetical protein [Acidipila rosea]TCK75882.1 hypothetical protein C7378_0881 [Acidipila rosea]